MNSLNWFEIPVSDIERSTRFYQEMLGLSLKREIFGGVPNAIFPYGEPGVGGALVQDPSRKPGADGTLVYLNATGKLDACVGRIKKAGGVVLIPKLDIGDPGFIALLRDPDGNTVGLHTPR